MNIMIKLVLSAILLCCAEKLTAQDLIPCPEIALPFYVHGPETEWGNDPTDLTDIQNWISQGDGFWVGRWQGSEPILIEYTTPDVGQHSSYNNCIKQVDLDNCIDQDFAAWTDICPGMFATSKVSSITTGSPGIKMQWSTDPGYFSGGISAGSTGLGNFGDNGTITHGNIWLNNSNTFNDKYIFTTCPQHCTVLKPQLPVSICEVLLHELGHAFGLDDLQNDASGSRFSISVMWGDINAGKAGCNGFQGLQDIDKCYFCKLYCPANCEDLGTPLAPGDSSMSLSVFPNPATNSFTLNYRTDAVHPRIVIQDIQGRPVRSSKLDLAEGSMTLNRDNIPAGAYILKLEGPAHYVVKMLIIQ